MDNEKILQICFKCPEKKYTQDSININPEKKGILGHYCLKYKWNLVRVKPNRYKDGDKTHKMTKNPCVYMEKKL